VHRSSNFPCSKNSLANPSALSLFNACPEWGLVQMASYPSGGQKLWDCSGIRKSGNQFLVIGNLDDISFRNLEIWNLVPDYSKVSVFLGFSDPEAVHALSRHLEEYASWGIDFFVPEKVKFSGTPINDVLMTCPQWVLCRKYTMGTDFWELAGNKKGVPKAGATRCLAQVLLRLSSQLFVYF